MNWLEKILRKCGKGEDTNYQIMALELALRLSEIQYLNYKQAKALEKKNRQLKALREDEVSYRYYIREINQYLDNKEYLADKQRPESPEAFYNVDESFWQIMSTTKDKSE